MLLPQVNGEADHVKRHKAVAAITVVKVEWATAGRYGHTYAVTFSVTQPMIAVKARFVCEIHGDMCKTNLL